MHPAQAPSWREHCEPQPDKNGLCRHVVGCRGEFDLEAEDSVETSLELGLADLTTGRFGLAPSSGMTCEIGLGLDNGVVYKMWYRCMYADDRP